ncbi:MAG: hypothetical protein JXR36_03695 [Bacteroidales bacterium]|nr:hypothetical protein [Bacteroidales bacterium]
MKKILRVLLIFFSTSMLIYNASAQPQELFLKNKGYYKTIFTGGDIQKLNSAYEIHESSRKYFEKSDKYYSEADKYLRMQQLPVAQSKINKFKKKEDKYRNKAAKNKLKALNYTFQANQTIKGVYTSNLQFIKQSTHKELYKILNKKQDAYLDSFVIAKSMNASNDVDRAIYWGDAYYFENQALLFMEYKFAVANNDTEIIKQLNEKFLNTQVVDTTNNQKPEDIKYDPANDRFLFSTKNDKIDEILSYSQSEENNLIQFFTLGKNGFIAMNKAKSLDSKLADYDKKIDKEDDFMAKRTLISEKRNVAQEQTIYKIDAIKKYINANRNFYSCRKNHYYDYAPRDTTTSDYLKIKHYEELAEKFYKDSDRFFKLANEKAADEKYLTYEFANDQMLTALKYQENGLNIQFGVDTNLVFVLHEVQKVEGENTNVANNNGNKNNNNTNNNNQNNNNTSNNNNTAKNNNNTNNNNTAKNNNNTTVVNQISGLWSYSYAYPNPQRASTSSGTIYRVQVGASKYLLPVNELRNYEPIYYETMTGTDVKRFLVGDYSDKQQAGIILEEIKNQGYKDAYIVTYENGKRTGAKYYGNPIVSNNNSNNNNTNTNNNNNTNTNVGGTYVNSIEITSTKYLIYVIQIGTFATKKTSSQLKNMSQIYSNNLSDGRIQYYVGPYYHYDDAAAKLPSVKQKGFDDAFVVAYNDGKKTNIQTAKQIEQNVKSTNQVTFKVQLGAYSDYLTDKLVAEKFGKIKSSYAISTHVNNGLVVYSAGSTSSYTDAKVIRQNIINLGFTDCFIIAIKDGKQVPLSSVIN